MRIGLLTEGGYPYATGESRLWCDRLLRGLPQHEFHLFALSRSAHQADQGWVRLPPRIGRVRTAPLWTADEDARWAGPPKGMLARLVTGERRTYGRRERRRFAAYMAALPASVRGAAGAGAGHPCAGAGGSRPTAFRTLFTEGLYGLADLARELGIYLDLVAQTPARWTETDAERADGGPRPFATPPETHVRGEWTPERVTAVGVHAVTGAHRVPRWAAGAGQRDA